MAEATPNVNTVTMQMPHSLPAAIVRPREYIQAVLTQSLREMGNQGRTALAWAWADRLPAIPGHPVTACRSSTNPGRNPR